VLDEHALRRLGVPELKGRQQLGDRGLPGELPLVEQLREHEGREALGVGGDDVERVAVGLHAAAQLPLPEAVREDDLALLDDADRHAGHPELLPPVLDEGRELGQRLLVELPGRLPGEALPLVALRQETAEDQRDLAAALLADRLRHVVQDHGPRVAGAPRVGADVPLLVG